MKENKTLRPALEHYRAQRQKLLEQLTEGVTAIFMMMNRVVQSL